MKVEPCPWCGASHIHYLTHVCAECECWYTEAGIPGEPQLGKFLDVEPNPDCPVHFPTRKAADR